MKCDCRPIPFCAPQSVLLFLILAAAIPPALAQAPANDNFADAIVVTGATTQVTGNNTGATTETGEPPHSPDYATGSTSVWWKWTAPASGHYGLNTVTSGFDTQLAVYTGATLGGLLRVADDDEYGGATRSAVSFYAVAGVTYSFAVSGFGASAGEIKLNLGPTVALPPVQYVAAGTNFTLNAPGASGTAPLVYQWNFRNQGVAGATTSSLAVPNLQIGNAGRYDLELTDASPGGRVLAASALQVNSTAPGVAKVYAGYNHVLVLKTDGTLWGAGYNGYGQLGDGTATSRATFIPIATNVVSAAAGYQHSVWVKADGSLWGAGYNGDGELGDGTFTAQSTPVQVLPSGVTAVYSGSSAWVTFFSKSDGTFWGMGWNANGQVGNGTNANQGTPVQVASGVVDATASYYYSAFVKSDGSLWGMGDNSSNQLGIVGGAFNTPQQIQASGVTRVSAGNYFTLFLKSDATLWGMGTNGSRQLGLATDTTTPVKLAEGVVAAAAGNLHSIFVGADGILRGMGTCSSGALGNQQTSFRHTPGLIARDVLAAVTAGGDSSFYVTRHGGLWATGANGYGQFGVDTGGANQLVPVQSLAGQAAVPEITTPPAAVTVPVGGSAAFSVAATGTLPLTYQWKKGAADIPGATSASYAIPSVAKADHASYSVVVGNLGGPTNSTAVLLDVQFQPEIATPPSATTVVQGTAANFSVVVAANPAATFRWQRKPAGQGEFVDLADNATYANSATATLTVNGTLLAMSGDEFRVRVSNGIGSAVTSAAAALTVHVPPAITSANNATFVVGQAGTFTVTATGTPAPALAVAGTLPGGVTFTPATGVLAGTPSSFANSPFALTVTAGNGVNPDATQNFTLTIHAAPVIATPPANATVVAGGDATFSVTATGNPAPAYQWRKGTTNLANDSKYSGVTTATLTIASVQPADAGDYNVVVGNSVASNITSSNATLTVNLPPAITSANNATFVVGQVGNFTVTATGIPAPSLSISGTLPNGVTFAATTGVLSGTPTGFNADPFTPTFIASNGVNPNATQNFTLTVHAAPVISAQPASASVAPGGNATFSVTATGNPALAYQWRKGTANLANNSKFSGVSTATLTITGAQEADAGDYNVVVSNTVNGTAASVTSNNAALTVGAGSSSPIVYRENFANSGGSAENITAVGWAAAVSSGGTDSSSGAHGTIRRYAGKPADATAINAGTPLENADPTFGYLQLATNGDIALVYTTEHVVSRSSSEIGTITWYQAFENPIGGSGTGTLRLAVRIAGAWYATNSTFSTDHVASSVGGISPTFSTNAALQTFTWSAAASAWRALSFTSGSTLGLGAALGDPLPSGEITGFGLFFPGGTGSGSSIGVDTVTIAYATPAAPTIETQPANLAVNAGQNASFTVVVAGTPAPALKWQRSTDGGTNWSDLAAESPFSGVTTGTLTITGVAASMSGHKFRAIATNSEGPATSNAATLSVNTVPGFTTHPQSQIVAVGSNVSLTVAVTGSPAPSLQWKKNLVNISGATSATLALNDVQLSNSGSYFAVASSAAGDANSNLAVLTVIPANWVVVDSTYNGIAPAASGGNYASNLNTGLNSQGNRLANSFTSGSSAVSLHAVMMGLYTHMGLSDVWSLRVCADASGAPGSVLATLVNPSDQPTFADINLLFPASSPLALTPNTTYWLVLEPAYAGTDGMMLWKAGTGRQGIGISDRSADRAAWDAWRLIGNQASNAFVVYGTAGDGVAPAIGTQPQAAAAIAGANATFTAAATGSPTPALKWQRSTDGGANWSDVPGASPYTGVTTGTLTVMSVTAAMNGHRFRLVAASTAGSVESNGAELTVNSSGAPANDNFADATAIPVATAQLSAGNAQATTESGEPPHSLSHNGGASVWWRWTAPSHGHVAINTIGSNFDTQISVYAGDALNSLQRIAWNEDDGGANTSRVLIPVTGGTTYRIAVGGFNSQSGTIALNVGPFLPTMPDRAVIAGAGVTLAANPVGAAPFVLQWSYQGEPIANATAATLNVVDVQLARAGRYELVVNDGSASGAINTGSVFGGTSSAATVTVLAAGGGAAKVANGWYHTLFIKADGTLWAMGWNAYGQLGDGTTTDRLTPVAIDTGGVPVIAISAGYAHSLFLRSDGTLWGVGRNDYGQLGDGTLITRASPFQIATGVTAISAGYYHSHFVKSDGTLWGMGYNGYASLGDGTTTQQTSPVQVASGVASVSGSYYHSMWLKTEGTLWGSGWNGEGQLGVSTAGSTQVTPVQVAVGVAAVSVGYYHSTFIKTDGTLWATGYNAYGELGDGSLTTRLAPVQVATGVARVAAGYYQTMFVLNDGSLWAAGYNTYGQLGDGTHLHRAVPVRVAAGGALSLSCVYYFTGLVKTDGSLWNWGYNSYGQLGDGTTANRLFPVQIVAGQAGGPTIGTPPQNVTAAVGQSASFSVTATGTGTLSYQWRKGTANLAGATSSGFSIASVQTADAGSYSVVVTDADGSVTSAPAMLTVLFAPAITAHPQSQTVTAGANVTFGVTVGGVPTPTLKWQRSTDDGANWIDLANGAPFSGVTTETLGIAGVTAAMNGHKFRAVATNDSGSPASNPATLTVNLVPTITTDPIGATRLVGGEITFTVAATGTPSPAFQWRRNGVLLNGATGSSLTLSNLRLDDAGAYTAVALNSAGSATSAPATLAVHAAPVITAPPQAQTVAPGTNVTFGVTATGVPAPTYQWRKDEAPISGATAASLALPGVQAADAGSYSVVVTNIVSSATSAAAALTVSVAPVAPQITTPPVAQTANVGADVVFAVVATGTPAPTYQWRKNGLILAGATNASLILGSIQLADAGSYSVLVTNSADSVPSEPVALTVFPAATNVAKIFAGNEHSLFVTTDGRLWAMGRNDDGRLGDGTTSWRNVPVQIATGVTMAATGATHSVFVKQDGTAWATGRNLYGAFGDGTTTDRLSPVPVATGIAAVAAGDHYTLWLKSDGTLWASGWNRFGQLGDGTEVDRLSRVQIASGVAKIAVGLAHAMFVKTDGTLWGIGVNSYGQLGDGSFDGWRTTPRQSATGVVDVAAGWEHTLFIKSDGTMWGMGRRPGIFTDDPSHIQFYPSPRQLATGVTAVTGGQWLTMFLKNDATLWGVGYNVVGQLGDGTSTNRDAPIQIGSDIGAVSAGAFHALRIRSDGTLWATGENFYAQLGTGNGERPFKWVPVRAGTPSGTPGADLFANAPPLSGVPINTTGDNAAATKESGEPDHAGNAGGKSVWWKWTAPSTGDFTIDTSGSGFDTLLAVYTGSVLGSLNLVASNDDYSGGTTSLVALNVTAGTVFLIAVDGYNGASGSIQLRIAGGSVGSGPANDNFAVASILTGSSNRLSGFTNVGATKETGEPSHAGNAGGKSVWWSWTAPGTGNAVVDTIGSNFDTVIGIYTGSAVNGLTLVASDDQNGGNGNSAVVFPVTAGTTYHIAVDGRDGATGLVSLYVSAFGSAYPNINQHPYSQALVTGETTVFFVAIAGLPMPTVQWRKDGVPIDGATHATFAIANAQPSQAGVYDVVVINSLGTLTSFEAILTVSATTPPPVIRVQPPSLASSAGTSLTLAVQAGGAGTLTYQWKKNGADLPGRTSPALDFASLVAGDAGTYAVAVTNAAGTTLSNGAVLTVNPTGSLPFPAGLLRGQTALVGANVSFAVTTNGSTPVAYQWRKNGLDLPGATAGTLALPNVQLTDAANYTVLLSNSAGTILSAGMRLTVAAAAPANDAFASAATLSGATAQATGTNVGASVETGEPDHAGHSHGQNFGGYSVWWQWTAPATGAVAVDTIGSTFDTLLAVYTGTAVNALTLLGADDQGGGNNTSALTFFATAGTTYRFAVDGLFGATGVIALHVAPGTAAAPVFSFHPQTLTVDAGTSPILGLSVTGTHPIAYQWHKDGNAIPGATDRTLQLSDVQSLDAGSYSVVATNASASTPSNSGTLTVTVAAGTPVVSSATTAGASVGTAFSYTIAASNSPTSYFARGLPAGLSLAPATGAIGGTPAAAGTYPVAISATNASGTGAAVILTLTVAGPNAPTITTQPQSRTVTAGANVTFAVVAAGEPAPAYQWRRNGLNIAGATTASLVLSDVQAGDAGTYLVVVSNGAGSVTSNAATLTVNAPVAVPVIATPPQSQTVAAGTSVSLSVSATGTAPLAYQWKKNGGNIDGATAATLAFASAQSGDSGNYTVVVSNAGGSVTSTPATLTVTTATDGVSASLAVSGPAVYTPAGGNLTLAATLAYPGLTPAALGYTINLPAGWALVSTGGTNVPSVVPSAGATGALGYSYSVVPANQASFNVVVSYPSGLSGNQTIAASATHGTPAANLAVPSVVVTRVDPPEITTHPANKTAAVGGSVIFTVTVTSSASVTYQWRKGGTGIDGATNSSLALSNLQTGAAGNYDVAVTNLAGSATSNPAMLTVIDVRATHAVAGNGYAAGGAVTIANMIAYTGTATGLGWQVLLPTGWSYASGSGSEGDVKPVAGRTDLLEWAWTTIPASPVNFSYTVNVPAGTTGEKTLAALVVFRQSGQLVQFLAAPDPLAVTEAPPFHSADTDGNSRLSLLELTRVIELYNTRDGTTRTGCYRVEAGGEDGFNPEPTRASSAVVTLTKYHSADSDRNGKLSLLELTRVIELYNYRSGTTRTGQYRVAAGTEDGYAPGP